MKHLSILIFILFAAAGCHRETPMEPLVGIQIQDRNGLTETVSTPDRLGNYENVDFFTSQPYKKVVRVYKKEGKNHAKITTYHPNGSIWQYLETQEMRAQGQYREWHPNGQLRIEAYVIGGTADVSLGSQQDWLFDGLSQVWDEQGNLIAKIPYFKGMLEGLNITFFPSGQMEKEVPYSKNAIEGEVLEFSPDGKLKTKTKYKKGLKEGTSIGYLPNSQISWMEDYREGLLLNGTYYDSLGDICSEVKNGSGFQAIYDGDRVHMLIEYRVGCPEGTVQKFLPSGETLLSYHLKRGKKHGEEIEYYLAPERTDGGVQPLPKLSISWNDNAVHGTVKTWYNNGQLQSQREFCHNQKLGPSVCWYRDGSLMQVEEYEEDRLVKGQYYKINQRDPVSTVSNGTGTASIYDEQGVLMRKIQYLKGKPIDP